MNRPLLIEKSPAVEQRLQALFERLCDLSVEQMDALDREDFDRLTELLSMKDDLLNEIRRLHETEQQVTDLLRGLRPLGAPPAGNDVRSLARRFQAQEKYVTRIVRQKLSLIADRLNAAQLRRLAAQGYARRKPTPPSLNVAG